MSDNEMTLWMRIKTAFDAMGSKQAEQSIEGLKQKSKEADTSIDQQNKRLSQAGQVAGRAAEQISTVAGAMGSAGGAAGQAAAGVRLLAGSIQTMVASGGGIAGLLAAVALLLTSKLVNWLIDVRKETKELNDQASKAERSINAMADVTFEKIISETEKMRESAAAAADQYDRILASRDKLLSAREKADLAQIEYEKQKALAEVAPGDRLGRQNVETEYARRAADTSAKAEDTRRIYEIASAEARVEVLKSSVQKALDDISKLENVRANSESKLWKDESKVTVGMDRTERADWEKGLQDQRDRIARQGKDIDDQREALQRLKSDLMIADTNLEVAKVNQRTQGTQKSSKGLARGDEDAQFNYGVEQQITDKKKEWDERQKKEAELQKKFTEERDDVRKIDNGGKGDRDKEIRERDAALKALREYRQESTAFYSELKAEMEKLREAIRNNPSQNS